LKSIIYECLHAVDKVNEKEQETYDAEINSFILKDKMAKARAMNAIENDEAADRKFKEMMDYKNKIEVS
jgi:hypothetical protein